MSSADEMNDWNGWTMPRAETKAWLAEEHRRRHNAGLDCNAKLRERMAAATAAQREWQAEMLSRQLHRRSVSFVRAQRRREEADRERDLRRVGAAIRRAQRDLDRAREFGSAPLFEFDPTPSGRAGRDMYWEWIPRGFAAGRPKNYRKPGSPRINARQAKWADGEFQDKIVYIEREDALENVSGNIISNMGLDQAERLGCAGRIEELERLSRKDAGVYTHSILALPADLSPQGRATLLKDLCRHYERLRLPFTAGLHKPDSANSQKNFHAHILVSLRPMERVADRWEFAAAKLTWLGTPAGLRLQRRLIARAFNKALAAERISSRWTHRSRAADGLAPGGFTKRGGVKHSPLIDDGIEDIRAARGALEEAEALDQAVGALSRVAKQLEACEIRQEGLRAILHAQSAAISAAEQIDQPSVSGPEETNAAAPVPSNSEVVANSQLKGRQQSDGAERSRLSAPIGPDKEGDGSNTAKDRQPEAPAISSPIPPEAPFDPEERRRRKLANARRLVVQGASYAGLGGDERGRLDTQLDTIILYLGNGSAVVTIDGSSLRLSTNNEALGQIVQTVANSQPGWNALRSLADSIAEITPPHHYLPHTLTDPADDWPPYGFLGRGSMER